MRNANGVTHTGYVRGAVFTNDERQVLFFTGMDLNQYYDMKYDMGRRWLHNWCVGYGFTPEEAVSLWWEKEIMRVWNNRWKVMDHMEIVPQLHRVIPAERLNFYRDMHLGIFQKENPNYEWLEIAIVKAFVRISKAKPEDELVTEKGAA